MIPVCSHNSVSILHKSIVGGFRPVRVADGPIMARCRFIKNAIWEHCAFIEIEAIPRSTHNLCVHAEIRKNVLSNIFFGIALMPKHK